MAKKMLSLTQAALDELEALSANETHKYNESSVVETLIHQAYAVHTDSLKELRAVKNDKGRTIAWQGWYAGECICETDGAHSKDTCGNKLNGWVREELSK
jgi:hypothetical protein